ncbi:MAG: tetratricopeptide repeat protein [Proteobacteria bacterium]|nr:tetratricopeptide repeat protein [Pseudomonadota bacterium]
MDEFVAEVQEDIRREHLLSIWKSYGKYIIAAVVALIVGTGGYIYWEHHQSQAQQRDALLFEEMLKTQDPAARKDKIHVLASSGSPGYRLLALFEEAQNSADPGDAYRKLAKDNRLDPSFKELAALRAIMADMGKAPSQRLLEEVGLLVKAVGPWREEAFEIQAYLLLETGRRAEARKIFENLKASQLAPPGVRARAQAMLDMISRL